MKGAKFMKKQILKSFLILAVVGSASAASATTSINSTITIGAGNTFTPSTKVGISTSAVPTSYTAASCHLNGTKEYATIGGSNLTVNANLDDPSKIYSTDIPVQSTTNTVGVPTGQTDAQKLVGSSWK
jgi:hypothetical protein